MRVREVIKNHYTFGCQKLANDNGFVSWGFVMQERPTALFSILEIFQVWGVYIVKANSCCFFWLLQLTDKISDKIKVNRLQRSSPNLQTTLYIYV